MSYTPYPPATTEKASIARSNDGISWTEAGITNPVVNSGGGKWVDADPDMIYVPDLNEWFMGWSIEDTSYSPYYCTIGFAYSSDGKTWTMYDGASVNGNRNGVILDGMDAGRQSWESSGGISNVGEPSFLYENGVIYMYYDSGATNNGEKLGLASFTWDTASHSVLNFHRYAGNPTIDLPADSTFLSGSGHDDFSKSGSTYYLYTVRNGAASGSQLVLLTSTDKVTWTYQGSVLQGAAGAWDSNIYRSAPVTDSVGNIIDFSGTLKLYYSAYGTIPFGIGLATGTDAPPTPSPPDNGENVYLNQHSRTDFGDVRFTASDGTTLLDYWMESEVDGDHATFWVKVAGDLSTTDQTIYVYYGKSDATTTSNIQTASLWNQGDDFNEDSLDTTRWSAFSNCRFPDPNCGLAIIQDPSNPSNRYLQFHLGYDAGIVSQTAYYADNFEISITGGYSDSSLWYKLILHNTKVTSDMLTRDMDAQDYPNAYLIQWQGTSFYSQKVWGTNCDYPDICGGSDYHEWDTHTSSPPVSNPTTLSYQVTGGNIAFLAGDHQYYSEAWDTHINRNSYIIVEAWKNKVGLTAWVDDIWIRKYVSPEPSHGIWGSEVTFATTTTTTLNEILGPLTVGQTSVPFSGSVSPAVPDGINVELHYASTCVQGTGGTVAATVQTSSGNGAYTGTFTAPAAGNYQFWTYFVGSSTYGSSSSTCQEVTVGPQAAIVVSLNVISPQYFTRGSTVSYSGTVTIDGLPAPDGTIVGIEVYDHFPTHRVMNRFMPTR